MNDRIHSDILQFFTFAFHYDISEFITTSLKPSIK